jgi:hypothetical protein
MLRRNIAIGIAILGLGLFLWSGYGFACISDYADASPTGAMGAGLAVIVCGLGFCLGLVLMIVGLAKMVKYRSDA